MLPNTLVDNVSSQVLDQLHFDQVADFVAFQVQYAPQNVHQRLLAIEYEVLEDPHGVLVLYLVDVQSDEQRREGGPDREVLLLKVLTDMGIILLQLVVQDVHYLH